MVRVAAAGLEGLSSPTGSLPAFLHALAAAQPEPWRRVGVRPGQCLVPPAPRYPLRQAATGVPAGPPEGSPPLWGPRSHLDRKPPLAVGSCPFPLLCGAPIGLEYFAYKALRCLKT